MMDEIVIDDFRPGDGEAFARLNRAWIREYFEMEPEDHRTLDHPEEVILEPGGRILVARSGTEVVGVCALIPQPSGVPELSKMAVLPEARGHGVGRRLGEAILAAARAAGAARVCLESNTKLVPAITLYETLGFRRVAGESSPYARCNIQMEVDLSGHVRK